jgi:dihydroneopterin aldolase
MAFYGYHGVFEEEKRSGQTFILDAVLYADLREAGKTDALDSTIDYGSAYQAIREIVEGKRFDLIEALAHNVAMALLSRFGKI